MMNKIIKSKNKFEKAKNDTKKLIESVREYLRGKEGSFLWPCFLNLIGIHLVYSQTSLQS